MNKTVASEIPYQSPIHASQDPNLNYSKIEFLRFWIGCFKSCDFFQPTRNVTFKRRVIYKDNTCIGSGPGLWWNLNHADCLASSSIFQLQPNKWLLSTWLPTALQKRGLCISGAHHLSQNAAAVKVEVFGWARWLLNEPSLSLSVQHSCIETQQRTNKLSRFMKCLDSSAVKVFF